MRGRGPTAGLGLVQKGSGITADLMGRSLSKLELKNSRRCVSVQGGGRTQWHCSLQFTRGGVGDVVFLSVNVLSLPPPKDQHRRKGTRCHRFRTRSTPPRDLPSARFERCCPQPWRRAPRGRWGTIQSPTPGQTMGTALASRHPFHDGRVHAVHCGEGVGSPLRCALHG